MSNIVVYRGQIRLHYVFPLRYILIDVRPEIIIHWGVEAGKAGRGNKQGNGLLKEILILGFAQDDFIVQRSVFSTF